MACPPGTIQYDVDMRTTPVNGHVYIDQRLTFCLIISGSTITGTIEQLPGVTLEGTNSPLGSAADRITLRFLWAPSLIDLQGFTFPAAGERRRFLAEFNALKPVGGPAELSLAPRGPDVGDTGTGNGTTT